MNIFLTGATGYIGSSVAVHLKNKRHAVYGLVRNPAKAAAVEDLGIIPVVGTLDDVALLAQYAAQSDAVIHTADADHEQAVAVMLQALEGTGKTFIHTSGSSVVGDDALGATESPFIYDETTPFTPMDIRRARVALNERVLHAGRERGIRTVVIVPSMVYGQSLGLDVSSDQLPVVFRKSQEAGIGIYMGEGLNRWSNVHIADLVTLYQLALEQASAGSYFYAENGEASYKELAGYVSEALGFGGATRSWPADDALAELGDWARFALGSNSRVRALNARQLLGWQPGAAPVREWILSQKKQA